MNSRITTRPWRYVPTLAVVAVCTLLNWLLVRWMPPTDAAMVYLLGVMITAIYCDRAVSVATALLSFLAFDFFFVPPILTLQFESSRYLITGLVLLIVGLVTSALASRVRRTAESAAQAELVASNERIRSSLLASLSHDLRAPLAVIAGSASSLRENKQRMSGDQQDELLEAIYERSVSLSTEVSDLLEMTRLSAGRVCLDRQWYPIEELVGAALERCRAGLGERPVAVQLPEQMCLIHVDGVLIEKLLVNLIENAAIHTPYNTSIEIVGVHQCDALVVSVRDHGAGLQAGSEERIFDKFERGTREGATTGSGLGLSICRAIADLHGITISAHNRLEGGAEFSVRFSAAHTPSLADVP